MAKKVLSIEISYPVTKVAEVDFKTKKSKVYRCFGVRTPEGTFEDGFLVNVEEFAKILKGELDSRGIKTKNTVFTVTSSRIANREVMVPAVNIKKLGDLIKANANEYFPVDLSGYDVAYKVLDTVGLEGGAKQHKVSVYAIPKNLSEAYNGLAAAVGLKVTAIDYSGNSILPIAKSVCGEGVSMLMKIDEHSSLLTIMKDGKSVLQRSLNTGTDAAIEMMLDLSAFGRGITYDQCIENLRRKACIRKTFDASIVDETDVENDDEKYKLARIALTDSLRGLVSSVVRVVDYYNSRNVDEPIEHFYLTGFGGDFSGLNRLIASEIGEKVKVVRDVEGVNLHKVVDVGGASVGEYLSCIGAAIAPIDYVPGEKKGGILNADLNSIKLDDLKAALDKLPMKPISISVIVIAIIASIIMLVYSNMKLVVAKEDNYYLKTRINELIDYEITYDEYTNMTALHTDIMAMYDMTKCPNERLLAFLAELEDKMPSSIVITSFTSNLEQCEISMSVKTKAEIGAVLENLRTFNTVGAIEFTDATASTDDAESNWEFAVKITYCDPPEGSEDLYSDDYTYDSSSYDDTEEIIDESEEAEDEAEEEIVEDEVVEEEPEEVIEDEVVEEEAVEEKQ